MIDMRSSLRSSDARSAGDNRDVKDRDAETSPGDFKKHLDAAKPKAQTSAKPAKPAGKPDTVARTDAQTDAAQADAAQNQIQMPRSFTDLGAAITRALSALKNTEGGAEAIAATDGAHVASSIAEAIDQIGAQVADASLTPLEQAVHDIMAALPQPKPDGETAEHAHDDRDGDTSSSSSDVTDRANDAAFIQAGPVDAAAPQPTREAPAPRPIVAPAPVAEPRQAEMPVAQSHVHLVVGEGDDRVVLTVAVRGHEVNVSMRGGDEQTAANLARNAGSLDHAMRARGLDLDSFTSERDLDHQQRRDRPHRDPERDESSEQFSIEEFQ